MKRAHRSGLSLLEILIVLVMLAVILTIGFPGYLQWLGRVETVQAATEVTQAIEQARQQARSGKQVTLTATAQTSSIGISVLSPGATTPTTQNRSLGAAVFTQGGTLNFAPPYGTLRDTALPLVLKVKGKRSGTERTVRVISLMGKVVVQ